MSVLETGLRKREERYCANLYLRTPFQYADAMEWHFSDLRNYAYTTTWFTTWQLAYKDVISWIDQTSDRHIYQGNSSIVEIMCSDGSGSKRQVYSLPINARID